MFALELIAAGCDTQIVAARGAVELHEARSSSIAGIAQGRTRVVVGTTLLASLIQVADDRTRALLLVGEDPALIPHAEST